MKIRWAPAAAQDLEQIGNYLRRNLPATAGTTVRRIYQVVQSLRDFPHRGRPGQLPGTRELVTSPLPYIIIYQVEKQLIQIVRIIHGAEDWQ